MSDTQIHSTVNFDQPGVQLGQLCVPYSYNLGGWANLLIPIAVVNRARGRRHWSWRAITAMSIPVRWRSCGWRGN